MITSEAAYDQTVEWLVRFSQSLATIPTEYANASRQWRAILSDGSIAQARDLLQEIEDYLHEGLDDGGWISTADPDTVRCEGVVSAVDLGRRTLTVCVGDEMRDATARFHDDLRDQVKAALDRRVRLTAQRAVYPHLIQLEILEGTAPSSPVGLPTTSSESALPHAPAPR